MKCKKCLYSNTSDCRAENCEGEEMSIVERLGITPGPWKWTGWKSRNRNTMELATTHSGRHYVMDFVRAGTQGALPRFRKRRGESWKDCTMERCDKFGDEKDHNGVYSPSDPNANLIAAAPEMLEALIDTMSCAEYWSEYDVPLGLYDTIKNAIEKATGKTWEEIKELI